MRGDELFCARTTLPGFWAPPNEILAISSSLDFGNSALPVYVLQFVCLIRPLHGPR